MLLVHLIEARSRDAVCAHLARSARAAGCFVVVASARPAAPTWRDVASRLGLRDIDCAPAACAAQIAAAAAARSAVILAPLPPEGTWDRAVAVELSHLASPPSVILLAAASEVRDVHGERFEVGPSLTDEEKQLWMGALAGEAFATIPHDDIASLEDWWRAARQARPQPGAIELTGDASALFVALAVAGRAWSTHQLGELGCTSRAVQELVAAGAASVDRSFVAISESWRDAEGEADADADTRVVGRVAAALARRGKRDPWAQARAAELWLRLGDLDHADVAYGCALEMADESLARREVVAAWMRSVATQTGETQLALTSKAAERALGAGEADEAYRWAKVAAAAAPQDHGAMLLLGRAAVAMGDLVTAKIALEHARQAALDAEQRAQLAAELAEVAYLTGNAGAAAEEAGEAVAARSSGTRLRGRNTLGKLLLAESKWEEAAQHFAEDACVASSLGDKTSELRAHVNRGIALLWRGQLDEAEQVFATVLEQGRAMGESRASAYALENLAVVAMWRHDYGTALSQWERALTLRLRLGDRLATARVIANVGELRRKLGLTAHAEHAVAFGRRLLGPGMPTEMSAHFAVVAARLALERGKTAEAYREIASAIADGEAVKQTEYLGEDYRVAARVALEDGDIARARSALAQASGLATTPEARAEVALLHALLARAAGELDDATLAAALRLARVAGDEEVAREAHRLAFEVHRAAGREEQARAHLEQAIALRDAVAAAVAGEVRAAFLARPDVAQLAELRAQLAEPESADDTSAPPVSLPPRSRSSALPREIVGDDPAIRGLVGAIRKVARGGGTVLIRGESGTGKELVAEALHRASDRAAGPFVAVNCAALVETLLLSELFGHEKGAFTGAVTRRRGRFEAADGGTLFLDEIGDISPRTQVALLRVLQERTFERVGGTTAIRANCRILFATHRDLKAMVERGEFREDLYYRLRGIVLEVPALRHRLGDIPRISEHLLARIAVERGETPKALAEDAQELLQRHRWAGNVRELENALRAASLFAETSIITASDLADNVEDLQSLAQGPRISLVSLVPPPSSERVGAEDEGESPLPPGEAGATAVAYACVRQGAVSLADLKRQIERDCIARALAETHGNITRAAALLGMKRPRLSQLVKQYGLAVGSLEN